jgi:hypothetical protein
LLTNPKNAATTLPFIGVLSVRVLVYNESTDAGVADCGANKN